MQWKRNTIKNEREKRACFVIFEVIFIVWSTEFCLGYFQMQEWRLHLHLGECLICLVFVGGKRGLLLRPWDSSIR